MEERIPRLEEKKAEVGEESPSKRQKEETELSQPKNKRKMYSNWQH